jgi:hypothetical protein
MVNHDLAANASHLSERTGIHFANAALRVRIMPLNSETRS